MYKIGDCFKIDNKECILSQVGNNALNIALINLKTGEIIGKKFKFGNKENNLSKFSDLTITENDVKTTGKTIQYLGKIDKVTYK